jgi:glutathione synthase/RimK-type ligase-like ATP-grasp enzyme
MTRPRIAIASCTGHDGHKADEELLRGALRTRGCEAVSLAWDKPGVDWGRFDLCLVKSTWDYNRKYEEFLAWARRVAAVTKLRNPANMIAWNSDKTYLRELADRGVRTVPTVWVSRGSEPRLEAILAAEGWGRAVVKPVVDLGAENLHRVRMGSEEGEASLAKVLERHDAMIQPFLPSLETKGETSLIYIDGELTHAVRKRPAPGDFRVQEIWGGIRQRTEPEPAEIELAEQALAQLESPPLYARVDIVADLHDLPCLIELELIEPNLYLGESPAAAEALTDALLRIDVDA